MTVDGYAVPAGSTAYDYLDVYYAGSLGSITVDDESTAPLPAGGTRTVTGKVTANQAVAAGRALFGTMSVLDESGAVLGTGAVVVEAVTAP